MEKPIRHWINGPLSTWKVWTTTSWTPKLESVSLSQMIGSITYSTFKKSHIYTYQKIYLYKRIWHINLLKTYRVAYYAWMIKWYIRQHWIEFHPLYIAAETYDFQQRETTTSTSSHFFSLKSIYQKSYHWRQYFSYTKMHITKVNFFFKSLQISKFTSLNPIYQNSKYCSQYLSYTKIHICMSLKSIFL